MLEYFQIIQQLKIVTGIWSFFQNVNIKMSYAIRRKTIWFNKAPRRCSSFNSLEILNRSITVILVINERSACFQSNHCHAKQAASKIDKILGAHLYFRVICSSVFKTACKQDIANTAKKWMVLASSLAKICQITKQHNLQLSVAPHLKKNMFYKQLSCWQPMSPVSFSFSQ